MSELCERCKAKPRIAKQRYCRLCKKRVLQELRDAGYLKPIPRARVFSDERGRKGFRSSEKIGGEADMREVGDE